MLRSWGHLMRIMGTDRYLHSSDKKWHVSGWLYPESWGVLMHPHFKAKRCRRLSLSKHFERTPTEVWFKTRVWHARDHFKYHVTTCKLLPRGESKIEQHLSLFLRPLSQTIELSLWSGSFKSQTDMDHVALLQEFRDLCEKINFDGYWCTV